MVYLDHLPERSLIDGYTHNGRRGRSGRRPSEFMSKADAMRFVKELRTAGWEQKKIAQQIGCSASLISLWGTGRNAPLAEPYGIRLVMLHQHPEST